MSNNAKIITVVVVVVALAVVISIFALNENAGTAITVFLRGESSTQQKTPDIQQSETNGEKSQSEVMEELAQDDTTDPQFLPPQGEVLHQIPPGEPTENTYESRVEHYTVPFPYWSALHFFSSMGMSLPFWGYNPGHPVPAIGIAFRAKNTSVNTEDFVFPANIDEDGFSDFMDGLNPESLFGDNLDDFELIPTEPFGSPSFIMKGGKGMGNEYWGGEPIEIVEMMLPLPGTAGGFFQVNNPQQVWFNGRFSFWAEACNECAPPVGGSVYSNSSRYYNDAFHIFVVVFACPPHGYSG